MAGLAGQLCGDISIFSLLSPGQKTSRQLFLHSTCMLANHLVTLGITILTMLDMSCAGPLRDD